MAAGWARAFIVGTLMVVCGIGVDAKDSTDAGACAAAAAVPDHLRTTSCEVMERVAIGMSSSATFRQLVDRVRDLHGIVYLSPTPIVQQQTRRVIDAALQHRVTVAGAYRLLYVSLKADAGRRSIALLAHELQHAVEVLESDATTEQAIDRLFERIGSRAAAWTTETDAALAAQSAVARELANAR